MKETLAILFALGACPAGWADDLPVLGEDEFFTPLPSVLTAARLVQPINEAPVAMTVIDRGMIEASSATGIPELLRLAPGFQSTYIEGIDAIATYTGFSSQFPSRMQVLVDGRSVYNPALNGVLWASLPLTIDQIERIEVVRGPNAAAYGSNAFLGTVNIITRPPEASAPWTVRVEGADSENFSGEVSHAAQFGDFAYRLTASQLADDGFRNKADDADSSLFNLSTTYRPHISDTWTLGLGLRDTDFDSELFRIPRARTYQSNYQQLSWQRTIDQDEDVRVQFYHQEFDTPDNTSFTEAPYGAIDVDYSMHSHRYDLDVQHRFRATPGWRISWGGGVRSDSVKGAGSFSSSDTLTRDSQRLFANGEWQATDDTVINAGLMGEHFSNIGHFLSPRLAANWHIDTDHTIRSSMAQAYRMPTFYEQYGELRLDPQDPPWPTLTALLGTEDLKPEKIQSIDIGYLFHPASQDFSLETRLYRSLITDVNYQAIDGNPLITQRVLNNGSLTLNGLEVQAKARLDRDTLLHLAYAYADPEGTFYRQITAGGLLYDVKPFTPSVPEHTLTLLASHKLPDQWRLSGTYRYVSEMEWLAEGSLVDSHGRLDLKLTKTFQQDGSDIEFSLNLLNALDERYWEFTYTDAPVNGNLAERELRAQLKMTLN